MNRKRVRRSGIYYRVCGTMWKDAADTSYSKCVGGRWNPRGFFGALYLSASLEGARANARQFVTKRLGPGITIEDVNDAFLPDVVEFSIAATAFVDAITEQGRRRLGLPTNDRAGENHSACRRIAREAYDDGERGIAARSALDGPVLEELAVFDAHLAATATMGSRRRFPEWYPPK